MKITKKPIGYMYCIEVDKNKKNRVHLRLKFIISKTLKKKTGKNKVKTARNIYFFPLVLQCVPLMTNHAVSVKM